MSAIHPLPRLNRPRGYAWMCLPGLFTYLAIQDFYSGDLDSAGDWMECATLMGPTPDALAFDRGDGVLAVAGRRRA